MSNVTDYSSDYGYDAASALPGRRIVLAGATDQDLTWLSSQNATTDATAATAGQWSIRAPATVAGCSSLLYQIFTRGMQWRAP